MKIWLVHLDCRLSRCWARWAMRCVPCAALRAIARGGYWGLEGVR